MKGFDFFMACYRKGVQLPVRIWHGMSAPMNFYRPNSVCFIDLEADGASDQHLRLMEGMSVSIVADELGDEVRELTKRVIRNRPSMLNVLCNGELKSWAPQRGWA